MPERVTAGLVVRGRYALIGPLGEGGFGEVWRAKDVSLGRDVAIKLMRPELLRHEVLRRRFEREAPVLASISHAHVVQVLDLGEWEGRPFVILEFVNGQSLRDWLEGHRSADALPALSEVRALFRQVCEGVGAAHDRGIVHRDLKPENVLLDTGGRRTVAKVLDFGLARMHTGPSSSHSTAGTYEYMSPEQAAEGSDTLDARSDVFSLGVMLIELLTGHRLPGDGRRSWERVVDNGRAEEWLTRLEAGRPDVPAGVWRVARVALASSPVDRFADAEALASALEESWSLAPVSATSERPQWAPTSDVALESPPNLRSPTPGSRPTVDRLSTEPVPVQSVALMPSMLSPGEPVVPTPGPIAGRASPSRPGRSLLARSDDDDSLGETLVYQGRPEEPLPQQRVPTKRRLYVGIAIAIAVVVVAVALVVATREPPPTASAAPTASATASAAPSRLVPATPINRRCDEGMVALPGGTFEMGAPMGEGAPGDPPRHRVEVRAFCLDRTEVPVSAMRACVAAGRCAAPTATVEFAGVTSSMHHRFDRYCTFNAAAPVVGDRPVNCVEFALAEAYCASRSARLPTEAEWEYAARGREGREYPWGSAPPDVARLNACGRGECPQGAMFRQRDGFDGTAPVDSFAAGATPEGILNLAGNVAEWVHDAWGGADGSHVVRGGGWSTTDVRAVRATSRDGVAGTDRRPEVGFRCARGLR